MKNQVLKGKISKKGRKYIYIDRIFNEKTYTEKVVITAEFKELFKSMNVGDEIEINVESESEYNAYKGFYTWIHTPYIPYEKKSIEEKAAIWFNRIVNTYNEKGWINKNAIEHIQNLGYHGYDDEIQKMQKEVDCNNAIYWIRKKASEDNYIYWKMIDKLHKYDCHKYDEEIEALEEKIQNYKKENYNSFSYPIEEKGLYNIGQIVVSDNKAWRIYSIKKESDGRSFGFDSEYFYIANGINISDLKEGKEAIKKDQEIKKELEKKRILRSKKEEYFKKYIEPMEIEKSKIFNKILKMVEENDEIKGQNTIMTNESKKVFIDTVNIYGSGKKVFIDNNDKFWIYFNNSMDGDDWNRNYINNSGIGFSCSINKIEKELEEYYKLEKEIEKETENKNNII